MDDNGEIVLTEEELECLLSDTTKDGMCALTVYGKYVRFCFDGLYADKTERIEALKQSLRNVGLVEGKVKEGFFFKWKLNQFEEQALLRGLNARLFFYLIELYRLQSTVSELTIEDWVPRKMVVEDLDESLTQSRFVLFDKRFTIRTSKRVKKAIDETIKHSTEGCLTHLGLPQLSCSVLADKARYRVACILINYYGQLEDFCLFHVTKREKRKRSPSLDIENPVEKVKCKAVVSTASPPSEAPTTETTESEPDDTPEAALGVDLEAAPEVDLEAAPEFTVVTRERRRNAAELEEDLDDGEAHFLGFARLAAYKKEWESRQEPRPLREKSLAVVFFVGAFLVLVELFLAPMLPKFIPWPKKFQWTAVLHHAALCLVGGFIAYRATFVQATGKEDLKLFILSTCLFVWVDTGAVVSVTISSILYCYVSSIVYLWYTKRALAWVPFACLLVFWGFTFTTLWNTFFLIAKMFVVVTSVIHEHRCGSSIGTMIFAPYRDVLFVLEIPLVYVIQAMQELDML